MTDTKINQRIAEACGWTDIDGLSAKGLMGTPPKSLCSFNYIPNYCTDLNAMAEAEGALSLDRLYKLEAHLKQMAGAVCFRATARQRAEAFLRVLDKWEEETK